MLVLSRKLMERIQIGDSIVITVLEICRNKVRIGIAAPTEIPILRSELRQPLGSPSSELVPIAVAAVPAT